MIILLVRAVFITYCISQLGCSARVASPTRSSEVAAYKQAAVAIPSDTVITLERTGCPPSTCPIYKLTITADGSVIYEGKDHVNTISIVKSSVSPEKVGEIVSEVNKIQFFSLSDYYESGDQCRRYVTDMPSALLSIRMDGRLKQVSHYHGCLGTDTVQRLTELENIIDKKINSTQWTK